MPERPRPLHFAAFVMNTTGHIIQGTWRRPTRARPTSTASTTGSTSRRRSNAAGSTRSSSPTWSGSTRRTAATSASTSRPGCRCPSNDPSVLASAIAYATEHLGIAFTASILQEHPFNFARRISTLDHASKGRIAWNIVTNYLPNASRNFGLEGLTKHDERYAWADEYVDVTYKLWEGSWDEDALLQDRVTGIHADYDKVHRINHEGPRYRVEGPHLVSPSPQRTPLLFQAGASEAGRTFAAKNAEAVFIQSPNLDSAARDTADIRLARRPARAPRRGPQVLPGPVLRPRVHRGGGQAHRRRARRVDRLRRPALAHVRRGRHRLRPRGPRPAGRRAQDRGRAVDRRLDQGPGDRPAAHAARRRPLHRHQRPHHRHARADRRPARAVAGRRRRRDQRGQRRDPRQLRGLRRPRRPGAARARAGADASTPRGRCARSCSAAATGCPSGTRRPATAARSRPSRSGRV